MANVLTNLQCCANGICFLFKTDMSPKKRNSTKGFVIFHAPIQPGLFSSENDVTHSQIDVAIMRRPPQPSVKPNNSSKDQRGGSNEAHKSPRLTHTLRQDRLSCPSIRRLQAKMETENRQTRETMEHLLNTENGFIKELEKVLSQHDVAERRRRELLHKQWTERLWLPLQKYLHQRVSSCGATDIKRRQSFYSHFLQHCNSKVTRHMINASQLREMSALCLLLIIFQGYVFLDTYNLKEYDPFFHASKNSHQLKLTEMKNSIKEAWMPDSTEAGNSHEKAITVHRCNRLISFFPLDSSKSSRQGKLPYHFQSSLVSSRSLMSNTKQSASSTYTASTLTNKEGKAVRGTLSSRFDMVPCHIDTKYRDCHRSNYWFSPRSEF